MLRPDRFRMPVPAILKGLAAEIGKLEAVISAKVQATPDFAARAEIIESVPGFAETTAADLVAGMPELDQVSNEIAAALIGLAPYDDDSGQRRGERHIKGGAAGFAMPSTCLASALPR